MFIHRLGDCRVCFVQSVLIHSEVFWILVAAAQDQGRRKTRADQIEPDQVEDLVMRYYCRNKDHRAKIASTLALNTSPWYVY